MAHIESWLAIGSFENFENFRGSGPVLLRNPIFLWFFRGGGSRPLVPPLDSCMLDKQCSPRSGCFRRSSLISVYPVWYFDIPSLKTNSLVEDWKRKMFEILEHLPYLNYIWLIVLDSSINLLHYQEFLGMKFLKCFFSLKFYKYTASWIRLLWYQKVQSLVRCHILWHLIWVYTVC